MNASKQPMVVTLLAIALLVIVPANAALFGDIDDSGLVDARDIQIVVNAGLGITTHPAADLDVNGIVDATDLQLVTNAASGVEIIPTGIIDGTVLSVVDPLPCAAVEATDVSKGDIYVAVVDVNGQYRLEAPVGRYSVRAFAGGLITESKIARVGANLTETVHFSLDPNPNSTGISGVVSDIATGNPIAGALVTVELDGEPLARTRTCNAGAFEVRFPFDAKGGDAEVTVGFEANGYDEEEQAVPVEEGQVTEQDQNLAKGAFVGALVGTVTEAVATTPIQAAQVTIQGPIFISTSSDAAGLYNFSALPDGEYTVSSTSPGFITEYQQSDVDSLAVAIADFALEEIPPTPIFNVSPSFVSLRSKNASAEVIVVNDGGGALDWTATITQGADWLTAAKALGAENNGVIAIVAQDNESGANRTGIIALESPNAPDTQITVRQVVPKDFNLDGAINASDIQLTVNGALGVSTGFDTDADNNGKQDAIDIQLIINAALGGSR